MKTGNTYHTTATPIRLTDPEIRSILAAPLRHILERCWKGGPDGPVSYIPEHDPAQAIIDALKSALAQAGQGGGTQP